MAEAFPQMAWMALDGVFSTKRQDQTVKTIRIGDFCDCVLSFPGKTLPAAANRGEVAIFGWRFEVCFRCLGLGVVNY